MNHFKIKKLVKNIFKNFNLSNSHAKISAEYLIKAELVGAPSHGLARLKMYCKRINKKLINPKPKFKIKKYLNQLHILMQIIALVLLLPILELK